VALRARRLEAECADDAVQQCLVRNFGNPDGSIALHVGMTAQRRDAGALAADIAAKQQEIGDLLDVAGAVAVLGDAHAVIDDDAIGLGIDIRDVLDVGPRQA
jgi:hypothetical protein